MTTTKKTAVVSFKVKPQRKRELDSLAAAEGMGTGPFVEKRLEVLETFYESEEVRELFEKLKSRTILLLNKKGERISITINSITDLVKYHLAVTEAYCM